MKNKQLGDVGIYINLLIKLGISMCLSIITFLGIGLLIEKIFPAGGIALIICTLMGIAGGFYLLFKEMKKLEGSQTNDPEDTP